MDHHNSNSSNANGQFTRPMESGENVEKLTGNTVWLRSTTLCIELLVTSGKIKLKDFIFIFNISFVYLAPTNNCSRIPTAEEIENFPPDARTLPTNALPTFKASPILL